MTGRFTTITRKSSCNVSIPNNAWRKKTCVKQVAIDGKLLAHGPLDEKPRAKSELGKPWDYLINIFFYPKYLWRFVEHWPLVANVPS